MPENKSKNSKFTNYLLLNASFSDSIELQLGKSASLLFLGISTDIFEKDHISVSFLEEILSQINQNTSLTFGHGIAGIGCAIQWMKNKGILEQGPEELLEEAEILLFKLTCSGKLEDIYIAEGICGLGLYFLHRVESYSMVPDDKIEKFHYYRYRECIISIILQLVQRCKDGWAGTERPFSFWYGYSGVYLFLDRVHHLQWLELETGYLLVGLESKIISELESQSTNWEKTEACFLMGVHSPSDHLTQLLIRVIASADPETCPIEFCALRAFQLKILAEKLNCPIASDLSIKLYLKVQDALDIIGLPSLFPFDPLSNSVPLGLEGGLAGTALPLLSMETGNLDWLQVLGIKL